MGRYRRGLLQGLLVLLAVAALVVPAVALTAASGSRGMTTEAAVARPSFACLGTDELS